MEDKYCVSTPEEMEWAIDKMAFLKNTVRIGTKGSQLLIELRGIKDIGWYLYISPASEYGSIDKLGALGDLTKTNLRVAECTKEGAKLILVGKDGEDNGQFHIYYDFIKT